LASDSRIGPTSSAKACSRWASTPCRRRRPLRQARVGQLEEPLGVLLERVGRQGLERGAELLLRGAGRLEALGARPALGRQRVGSPCGGSARLDDGPAQQERHGETAEQDPHQQPHQHHPSTSEPPGRTSAERT
jgi:hypothetical protein